MNAFLELQRLRYSLKDKGLNDDLVDKIIKKAELEINEALSKQMENSFSDDINNMNSIENLRPKPNAFSFDYESFIFESSNLPFPKLEKFLQNTDNKKDINQNQNIKKNINNIFDLQKAIYDENHNKILKKREEKINKINSLLRSNNNLQNKLPNNQNQINLESEDKKINNNTDIISNNTKKLIEDIIRSYEEGF